MDYHLLINNSIINNKSSTSINMVRWCRLHLKKQIYWRSSISKRIMNSKEHPVKNSYMIDIIRKKCFNMEKANLHPNLQELLIVVFNSTANRMITWWKKNCKFSLLESKHIYLKIFLYRLMTNGNNTTGYIMFKNDARS